MLKIMQRRQLKIKNNRIIKSSIIKTTIFKITKKIISKKAILIQNEKINQII